MIGRDEAPAAWEDEEDFVVTREWLDTAPPGVSPAYPRALSALNTATEAAAERDEQDIAPTGADHASSASSSAFAPDRIEWERRLSPRQKVTRGAGITLLLALTVYLLVGGPAATIVTLRNAGDALNARLHPPAPQPTLAQRGYTFVKSPPGAYNLPEMSIAPASGQPGAAWACWASQFSSHAPRGVWTAQAFYTSTAGARWIPLTLPQSTAQGCSVNADGASNASALVVLEQGVAPDGSCIAPFLYLTTDSGASWKRIPWPLGPSDGACQFRTALQGGAIYIWSTQPLVRGVNPFVPPSGRVIVSRDSGQTWTLADNGLEDSNSYDIIGFRPGGHILALTADVRAAGGASSRLMASDDYGASWRSLGLLPGAFPEVVVSTDQSVTDHGGWGRLYVLARTIVNGSLSIPPQYELASAYIGQPWTQVPLPPLAPGAAPTALANQPILIGAGPAGVIEVERGVVESKNAQLSPSRRLWLWNPAQRQWLLDPQVVPGNLELQGDAWSGGAQTFWMTTLQLGVPPVLQIYTKTYPADVLGHVQWSSSVGA
ncbi:MAG TPA: sialidase family protein [Ktedonobacterales bacterium]|nr:sialidase family protein [Ktedonobacterales bacterium]